MNSLEFINQEIERYKVIIVEIKNMLKEPNRKENTITFLKNELRDYERKLYYLQQLKTELEAWKIVKGNLVLDDETSRVRLSVCYRTKNYNKLKKALEVKDENRK